MYLVLTGEWWWLVSLVSAARSSNYRKTAPDSTHQLHYHRCLTTLFCHDMQWQGWRFYQNMKTEQKLDTWGHKHQNQRTCSTTMLYFMWLICLQCSDSCLPHAGIGLAGCFTGLSASCRRWFALILLEIPDQNIIHKLLKYFPTLTMRLVLGEHCEVTWDQTNMTAELSITPPDICNFNLNLL